MGIGSKSREPNANLELIWETSLIIKKETEQTKTVEMLPITLFSPSGVDHLCRFATFPKLQLVNVTIIVQSKDFNM